MGQAEHRQVPVHSCHPSRTQNRPNARNQRNAVWMDSHQTEICRSIGSQEAVGVVANMVEMVVELDFHIRKCQRIG